MRLYVALALTAVALLAYLTLAKPYVKDSTYVMTAPDVGMALFTFVNPTPFTKCITNAELEEPRTAVLELHKTIINGTLVAMVPVDEICIAPFSSLSFKHFTYHLMIYGTVEGRIKIKLKLKDGEEIHFAADPSTLEVHIH